MTGKELRFKRKLLGLTTIELAERCGVTKQTISLIENEKTKLRPLMERALAEELGKAFVECKSLDVKVMFNDTWAED